MPDAILRLSGLLDSLLYRSHDRLVPLATELRLIEDYVSLEKLRFENRIKLQWNISGAVESFAIAPFLLFPFIENAFKHGFSENASELRLQVSAVISEGQLTFSVMNSVGGAEMAKPNLPGGIGLKNVKKRLELLYPQRYNLQIDAADQQYAVVLQLALTTINSSLYEEHG